MKIAKRVLAVVLAVALVIGSFVIATSAADENKIYLSLKAQVMDGAADCAGVKETESLGIEDVAPGTIKAKQITNQKADVATYDSTKDSLPYYDSSATIEVKPGQMVWITTHIKSVGTLAPDSIQLRMLYDTDIFTTVALTGVQSYKWNAKNEIYKYSNSTMSQGNIWGRLATDARSACLPQDWTDEQKAGYHCYPFFAAADPALVEADMAIMYYSDSDLVSVPVYVKSTATVGTTGSILIPDSADVNGTCYPESVDTEGKGGDIYEDRVSFTNEMCDFSGATLNFVVVGDEEVSYTELNNAIADYESRDASAYTEETWNAATTAYNNAKEALKSTDQSVVNAATTALNEALANLADAPVELDYSNWTTAENALPTDLSNYTTSSVAAYESAKAAAVTAKDEAVAANDQEALDQAAADLTAAAALLAAKATFTDLNNALADAAAEDSSLYTEESWAEVEKAVAAAKLFDQDNTPATEQDNVTAAADAIYEALDKLVDKPIEIVLDYTNWNNSVANIPADLSAYTAASVTAYNAAKAQAYSAYDAAVAAKDQNALDAAATALQTAIDGLVEKADTSVLEATIAEVEAKNYNPEYYAEAVVDALDKALAAGQAIVDNKDNVSDQDAVDSAVEAILAADKAMVMLDADYAVVEEAINAIPDDLSVYTDETVAEVEKAVNAVVYGLKIDKQEEVKAYASAIVDATGKLALKPANKDALKDAIDKAEALVADIYTEDSYADVEDALVDAKAVYENADLTINDQDAVNAATKALTDAMGNLVNKPTEGRVMEASYTDTPYAKNTFTVKIEGRAVKLRFVDVSNPTSTVTLTRSDARATGSIVSYDANGNVVNDLSRNIAYEIWTFDLAIMADVYYLNVKGNDGWEDLAISYVLDYKYSTDKVDVYSMEIADTAKLYTEVPLTVVTGEDVLKINVFVNGQALKSFANPVVADGKATFNAYAKFYAVGENTVTIQIKTANGWETVEEFEATVTASK